MATLYPENFPCVQVVPYQLDVDMGVLRTAMEGGNARQRRLYRTMPTLVALEFIMTVQQLGDWQPWANNYGYDFFVIDMLESMYSGQAGAIASPHSIRFTSNLQISNIFHGWVRVKVQAEIDPRTDSLPPISPAYNWIIGGTAPAPSNANAVIAGDVGEPSASLVIAGTAEAPSAPYTEAMRWRTIVEANGGTVSAARLAIVQAFIDAETAAGAWALTDDYWPLWGENAVQARVSLKQRRLATAVGAPTFTADRGYTFNGTTQYLNSGFVPSTHAVAMALNSQRLAVYERTNAVGGSYAANSAAGNLRNDVRVASNTFRGTANSGLIVGGALTDSRGLISIVRSAGPAWAFYKNGLATPAVTSTTAGASLANVAIYFCARNNSGTADSFRPGSPGFVCVGGALSAGQELAQYNNIQAWGAAIGASV